MGQANVVGPTFIKGSFFLISNVFSTQLCNMHWINLQFTLVFEKEQFLLKNFLQISSLSLSLSDCFVNIMILVFVV